MAVAPDAEDDEGRVKGGPTSSRLFWIDLETGGLNYRDDLVLEVYVLVTDHNLNHLAEFEAVVHHDEAALQSLSRWATNQHRTLLELVRQSRQSLSEVERDLACFFDQHRQNKKAVLAGSSVYFDRLCLEHQMPSLVSRIHYRVVDVSTLLELAKRWSPGLHQFAPRRCLSHRARDDVFSSLNLMAFYKQCFIRAPWVPRSATSMAVHSLSL